MVEGVITMLLATMAEAVFASSLQPSESPTAAEVRAAIRTSLRRHHGSRGCAAFCAAEYGDHPRHRPQRVLARRVMPSGATVRVYVVDDHEPFRRTAAAVVEATDGFAVVGLAESFEAAEGGLDDVDLVLMDINLPGLSGIEAAQRLSRRGAPVVILLSTYDESTFDWTHSGAVDYIAKSSFSPERLLRSWQRTLR